MAILQSELINKSYSYSNVISKSAGLESFSSTRKTAFLCHSHKDETLAKGLQVILKEEGIDLYIDWQDHSMPDTPNAETAEKIKKKIRDCNTFLYLATHNSKNSRWCPWEIGNADSSNKKILIIPTKDRNYTYGSEYLELYSHFDIVDSKDKTQRGLAIFNNLTKEGKWVTNSTFI